MDNKTFELQGFNINSFDFDEAVDFACQHSGQVVTINPEMIELAKKNPELTNSIKEAELIIPDGIGIEIGLRILGHKVKRIAGIEFARKMIDEFSKNNKSIALIGAKPEIITETVKNLQKEVENINLSYVQDGYFIDEEKITNNLTELQPDLVLVALGSPKQEILIHKLKKTLPKSLMIGVGGSFDVWAGYVERAPEIYQKLGLEWLYRTIKEPSRFKRIFPTLPLFIINVIMEKSIKWTKKGARC